MRAMAYQSNSNDPSYGPRPPFNPGSTVAQSYPSSSYQQSQQQQQSDPNAYPSHLQLAQGPEGHLNNAPRQQNLPNQNSSLAGGPTNVPDDPFKKPYLPPKHGRLAFPFGDLKPACFLHREHVLTSISIPQLNLYHIISHIRLHPRPPRRQQQRLSLRTDNQSKFQNRALHFQPRPL